MRGSVAINALRLQEQSCDIGNGAALRFPQTAEMDIDWIRKALTRPGKSQAGLARALGINPSGVNRLLAGDRQLKAVEVAKVQGYFNEKQLAPNKNVELPIVENVQRLGAEAPLEVRGMAEGGPDGWNLFNGDVIQTIRRPDNLIGVSGAYAVYVTGHSMEPKFAPGDLAHIHPWVPVLPGHYVLVQRKPNGPGEPPLAVIKRLVRRSGSKVVLEQLSPAKTFEIKADEVVSIHRVVGSSEA